MAFDRIAQLLPHSSQQPPSQVTKQLVEPAPLHLPNAFGKPTALPAIAPPLSSQAPPLEELRAINLTYHYPGSDRGITDISFTLQRGSLTVITGSIGAGKTTLLRVLLGLLPLQSGSLYWNGELVKYPDRFFTPPRTAYTPQVPQLFSTSLRENLLLGLDRSDAEVSRAIAQTTLHQDLLQMPDGLDTQIGSKGMRLSGGQIQRVAVARMFLRQPDLLVIDDLSSALDIKTEQTLWKELMQRLKQSPVDQASQIGHKHEPEHWQPTCIVVSHRPFVIEQADFLIHLKG